MNLEDGNQTFEGDVQSLVRIAVRLVKVAKAGQLHSTHCLVKELDDAADCVAQWADEEDYSPQQMGWVDSQGRP